MTGNRPAADRPSTGRPSGDGPAADRPSTGRPSGDGPSGDRTSGDRPSGRWSDDRPWDGQPPGDRLLPRLLAAEAATIAATAAAMAATADHPVACEPMGLGALVALGPGRFVNRAVGVGPHLDPTEIERIERFYIGMDLAPSLQLSATADGETLRFLTAAGFRPDWFRSLHARNVADPADPDTTVSLAVGRGGPFTVVVVDDDALGLWLDVLADGNGITITTDRVLSDEYALAAHSAAGAVDLLAFDGDTPVGCGSIQVAGTTAWLGGAATIPAHRGRGVQSALLAYRLALARSHGCDVVAATATPGGPSARNLHRSGLPLVDTQLILTQRR